MDGGPGTSSGGVVNGWETALSKRAHPDNAIVAHSTAAATDFAIAGRGERFRMTARLRIARRSAPRRPVNVRDKSPIYLQQHLPWPL